jgi:hypothetical protein
LSSSHESEQSAMIMSGTKDATLQDVRLIDIHGTRFYDIVYTHEGEQGMARTARIGVEDAYPNPQPGDATRISYLMNVATGLARR